MTDFDHDVLDPEGPSEADLARAERPMETRCSNCQQEVYEDVDFCPYCEHAIDHPASRSRRVLWTALAMLGIVLMLLTLGRIL